MNFYKDETPSELFERIMRLASEHLDDDELYNDTGNVDYTLQQIRIIVDELEDRVSQQVED